MSKPIIIQKFGGTSLGNGKKILNVAKIINDYNKDYRVIVVVSATNPSSKSIGTTHQLLQIKDNYRIIDNIESSHINIVSEMNIPSQNLIDWIKSECNKLRSFVSALQIINEYTLKSRDTIISFGEKLSAKILSYTLHIIYGINSKDITLDNIIDFNDHNIDQHFFKTLGEKIKLNINNYTFDIPVVTGFFGILQNGLLETIGRGYSDFTAALLAVEYNACELQIWKEVDGIFTADPNIVNNAKLIEYIHPEEVSELTFYGSEVLHPFVINHTEIPIKIKNTLDPDNRGTIICKSKLSLNPKATAVTIKENIIVINIKSNIKILSYDFFTNVFNILYTHKTIPDLISTTQNDISIAINKTKLYNHQILLNNLSKIGKVSYSENMCILSLIGNKMKKYIGIASEMFTILAKNNINIEMISQGASEINISCVINNKDAHNAIRLIHNNLL